MRSRHNGQAAVPPPAERARTLTARSGTNAVLTAVSTHRTAPTLHHVHRPATTPAQLAIELHPTGQLRISDCVPTGTQAGATVDPGAIVRRLTVRQRCLPS
jgi:hypothetical protein